MPRVRKAAPYLLALGVLVGVLAHKAWTEHPCYHSGMKGSLHAIYRSPPDDPVPDEIRKQIKNHRLPGARSFGDGEPTDLLKSFVVTFDKSATDRQVEAWRSTLENMELFREVRSEMCPPWF